MPGSTSTGSLPKQHLIGIAKLMERYIDGDTGAFQELYRIIYPRLKAQIRGRGVPVESIDDLVQTTFMKAHVAKARFTGDQWQQLLGKSPSASGRSVLHWYAKIARNCVIDEHRRRVRDKSVAAAEDGVERAWAASSTVAQADPEHLKIAEQERAIRAETVRAAVRGLKPQQREVIELNRFSGLTMSDIAQKTDVHQGTIRVRAHRAYRVLAERLSPSLARA